VHERDDGSDTLDWIAARDWSDGNVGMIGGSYGGWVQLLAAASGNPHLKAIVPQVAPPDPLEAFPYEGGAFQLGVAWWAMVVDHLASRRGGPPPDFEWTEVLATWPLTDLDEVLGIEQPVLDEWLAHPPSDAEYWSRLSYQQHLTEMDVAALHITGWYDGDLPGALENFPVMRTRSKSEWARRGQFLIVGPWGHAFNQSRRIGPVDFGPDAVVDLEAVYVRFFDRYLKGIRNALEEEDPVLVFVMGANEWRSDVAWPLPGTEFTELFLGSDGDGRLRDAGGRLTLVPSGGAAADVFVYDPAEPPPSPEVTFGDPLKNSRLMDLSGTADREDVLDYTTPPFAAPVEITGPVELNVWIETDAADTDVCAKLLRIEADGTTRRITGGIQRVRYRNGPGTDAPVEPGTPVRVSVQLRATSIALAPGDRLRLEMCSSEFPSFALHPNTLEPAASEAAVQVATTRVLHSAAHPSHLLLPVARGGADPRPLLFEDR
jgi:putative CocE/NonD family hydrolase